MPAKNGFRHQVYPVTPASAPMLQTLECIDASAAEFSALHSQHRIDRVVLVHGTFMGDDPLGLSETLKSMAQGVPLFAGPLESLAKKLEDKTRPLKEVLAKDVGNYTAEYRDLFQKLVGDDPQVELLSPTWSSQNHHIARADLAIRLIHQLIQRPVPAGQRVLFWGHSHAGNAFAMLTNLLANDRVSVEQFFDAAGPQPGEHWQAVRQTLKNGSSPHLLASSVVIASFGTPVRYGWDSAGYDRLVHVTFHRPHDPENLLITKPLFPPLPMADVINASFGDWVQTFAIAGTDVSSPPSISTNEKLTRILEANLPDPQHDWDTRLLGSKRVRDTCARWKLGTRCHADGLNILVDYKLSGEQTSLGRPIEYSLMGHGVATMVKWLPAHLKLFVEALNVAASKPVGP